MFTLISYDIVSDRRRSKIANILLDFGERVQYSVFELDVTEDQIRVVTAKIKKVYNETEDSIRIYSMCTGCEKRIDILGNGTLTQNKDVYTL